MPFGLTNATASPHVDDYTRITWTHLMKHKTDSVSLITQFSHVETQFKCKVLAIRSDNAPDLW